MKCANCGTSVFKKPLERVNPKGEIGIWWCRDCIKKNEPELYKNIISDREPINDVLEDICYGKKFKT
jgi:ribosomal protein L37AE/L43A